LDSLERYWTGIGQWLALQADAFNSPISHMGEKGRANELTVGEFFAKLLPQGLAIGGGVIISPSGGQSRQCDIIVHEVSEHPQLFAQTAQFIYPADTVVLTVEVKTTLDAAEVVAIGKNTASVRSMERAVNPKVHPVTAVFAFATSATTSTTLGWFKALPVDQRPDLVCLVSPGVVMRKDGEGFSAHAVLLHALDASGRRVPGDWVPTGPSQFTVRDGASNPSARVRTSTSNEWMAHEPGRALLLFTVDLLGQLGERGLTKTKWWESYLNSTARETVEVIFAD
jgi:hypothetical protein